jgi:hypothetical protein
MKNSFIIIVFALVFNSCNQNIKDKNFGKTNTNFMKSDTIYSDIDLFTFKGIQSKKELEIFLKVKDLDSTKIITVVTKNGSKDIVYKKNSKGYFTNVFELKELYFMEYLYTIYNKDKIITFILSKHFDSKIMDLRSYTVLFPIDKENKQREIQYKHDLIQVEKFEDIEYIDILNTADHKGYDIESYYYYDYNKKKCGYYFNDENKLQLNYGYKIGNSLSIASPLHYDWEFIKGEDFINN